MYKLSVLYIRIEYSILFINSDIFDNYEVIYHFMYAIRNFTVLISKKFILFWKTIFSDLVTKLKPIPSFFNFQTLLFLSSIPIAGVLLLNTNHKSTFQKLNKGYIYGHQLF